MIEIIQPRLISWGLQDTKISIPPKINGLNDTDCFVTVENNTVIVCFRGTEPFNLVDWSTDFSSEFVDFNAGRSSTMRRIINGMVHRGWNSGVNDIFDTIYPIIMEHAKEENSVFITGHSLGAALAVIFCARFINERDENERLIGGLYTFGQPQVADQQFIDCMDSIIYEKSFRIINDSDIVTRAIKLLFPDYCDGPGRAIVLDKEGNDIKLYEKDEDLPKNETSLIELPTKHNEDSILESFPRIVKDHFPCFYIFKLEHFLQSLEKEE